LHADLKKMDKMVGSMREKRRRRASTYSSRSKDRRKRHASSDGSDDSSKSTPKVTRINLEDEDSDSDHIRIVKKPKEASKAKKSDHRRRK
jgi:hypothetical protein